MMRDPGAGRCPGEFHAEPASADCVLPPLSLAVFPPVTPYRTGNRADSDYEGDTFVNIRRP